MMFGEYRSGQQQLPRVLHISVARYLKDLPMPGEPLSFLVSLHEEGTGITWQQNVSMQPEDERYLLDTTRELYISSIKATLSPVGALNRLRGLGSRMYDLFIGTEGKKILENIVPTAVLLNVDETILNLPWELLGDGGNAIAQQTPFGRLVTTRVIPRPGRDPLKEDKVVRILAIANPTLDLPATDSEVKVLQELEGSKGGFSVEVNVLAGNKATRAAFTEMLCNGEYDILHFAGHGSFDPSAPEMSAIRFADGMLSADEILNLKWKAPPYLVFNSACESGRAAGGKRLVSNESHSNGVAAAFIVAGASAYAGHYWPVTDVGAALFTEEFYRTLFARENVGLAFLEARNHVSKQVGDLTGFSAVLFGDAASKHRRDLAMAA